MRKSIALVLLVLGGPGLFFSMREINRESRVVRDYVPVPAFITSAVTPGLAAGKAPTYFPAVQYQYTVNGRTYASSRIWRYVGTVYKPQAEQVMRDFPASANVKAYVDPNDAGNVVLIRDYSTLPYWPAGVSLAVVALGCGSLVRVLRPRRTTMHTSDANTFGWRELLPTKRFTEHFYEALFLLMSIGVPMLWLACHLTVRTTPVTGFVMTFIAVALATFGWLAWRASRAWGITHRIGNLQLTANYAPMRLDQPFLFRVESNVRSRIQFTEMRARMLCIRRNILHNGRRTFMQNAVLGERVLKLAGKSAIPAGELIRGATETVFKSQDWFPSGREGMTQYPYIFWEIRVEMIGPMQFGVTFPIEVVRYNAPAKVGVRQSK